MGPTHPAWSAPAPEWVGLAPGVRWRLTRPDGGIETVVASDVATAMARVYEGRAGLEALGLDPESDTGGALKLEQIAGYASVLTACLYAQRCLTDWEGIDDPETGQPLDVTDPDAIRNALLYGPPPGGTPLLTPFLAWLEGPRRPMAAETVRLRKLAKDHWAGGAERCRACVEMGEGCVKGASVEGELCPRLSLTPRTPEGIACWAIATSTYGLWLRAGMGGAIAGLDYQAALLAFEADRSRVEERPDVGAAFAVFRAIEQGRMEAEAERAEAERLARDAG
ncbi:hypothetical protein KOAAANKH_00096 [Brevundimonas sp. NIBR10]|uniref:hypothetical protein n=1 Tax=Brevundimonas sp. NIBR10 TaxID=3015997 RepID=UPI0022F1C2F2|nr:hypothetical protein [Brevundimonas sp. NIBR10]WGM45235.1 hypothetical protein KOAAANKH_00096 [Brevundimonas sp. NIBR10]